MPLRSEHERGYLEPPFDAASGSWDAPGSEAGGDVQGSVEDGAVGRAWRRSLDLPGALLWTGGLTLAGGAWIHASVDRLPDAYSWSLPFETLWNVVGQGTFPILAALAFVFGRAQVHGLTGLGGLLERHIVRLRKFDTREFFARVAPSKSVALVVAVAVLVLDVVAFPAHGWIANMATAVGAGYVVATASRRTGVAALLNLVLSVFVFTAVCYWFTVVKTLTFADRVQWDAEIARLERAAFGVYPHRWVAAVFERHPSWVELMDRVYFSIFEHMAVATSFLIGLSDSRERNRYLGALCICYVLGAPLYLCMPAAGPAYFDPATYAFLSNQPLMVNHAQLTLFENTSAVNEGRAGAIQTWGYIACMPSLHMAHEFVMLYSARRSPIFFVGTLVFFGLTSVAVVALGWHYPTDILAGVVLGIVAIVIARRFELRLFPRALRGTSSRVR